MAEEAAEIAEAADELEELNVAAPSLSPVIGREYALMAEYMLYVKQTLDGLYVAPKQNNPLEWLGVLFVRRGYYQGGILRFSLTIPNDFPDTAQIPILTFDRPLYHPSVEMETRRLDLSRHFSEGWKSNTHHIYHIFMIMQRCFYKLDILKPANQEAAKLYENNKERFRAKVTDCVRRSRETVYDASGDILRFTPWDPEAHETLRQKILNQSNGGNSKQKLGMDPRNSGLSWVDPHALYVLAKQDTARDSNCS